MRLNWTSVWIDYHEERGREIEIEIEIDRERGGGRVKRAVLSFLSNVSADIFIFDKQFPDNSNEICERLEEGGGRMLEEHRYNVMRHGPSKAAR